MENLTIITSTGNLSVFESTRSLYLNGAINDEAGDISSLVMVMDHLAKKPGHIRFFVNSDGGSPLDGGMVNDAIDRVNAIVPVYIIATGMAMSAAADVVAWGPKGRRYATPRCVFMMHRSRYSLGEDHADSQSTWANWEEKCEKREIRLLSEHVGMTYRKLKNRVWKTWIFDTKEAIENGIVDGVWTGEIPNQG